MIRIISWLSYFIKQVRISLANYDEYFARFEVLKWCWYYQRFCSSCFVTLLSWTFSSFEFHEKKCWIIILLMGKTKTLLKISLLFCNFFYWLIYRTRGVIRRLFSRLKYYYSICCQFTKLFSRLIWHVIDSTIFLLFITRRVPNEWHLLVNK